MRALRSILDVVGTFVVAYVLLALFFTFLNGTAGFGFPEGLRVLVNFMDVGLGIWVILLIVLSVVGSRRARPPVTVGRTFFALVIGAILNLIVVTTVGFIQTGGWATQLILYAIEAGVACLIAAAIVVPLVHRIVHIK